LRESPRFLVLKALKNANWNSSHADLDEAKEALSKLRSDKEQVHKEIEEIADGLTTQQGSNWDQLLKSKRPLIIGTGLVILQQITGQPTVLYFVTQIFQKVFTSNPLLPFIGSVIVGGMKLFATLLTAGTVDKRGRRPLLLIGVSTQTVALLLMAALYKWAGTPNLTEKDQFPMLEHWAAWFVLISLMVYVTGYQIGFGPISWLMISEIYPLKIRSKALSIAVVANFGSNIVMSYTYLSISTALSEGVFLLYGCIAIGALFFIFFVVPETKGKSLEEIENMFFGKELQVRSDDIQ